MRTSPLLAVLIGFCVTHQTLAAEETRRLLYVATPGIRDDVKLGGTGIAIFDIDHDHRFVRRIDVPALGDVQHPHAAKGICASAATGRLYVSTPADLTCVDLQTDKVLWQKAYANGCDRMSISPDGSTIYEPTLEGAYWHVIDARDGSEKAQVKPDSGSHNTVFALDGSEVFLAGLHSPLLTIANARTHEAARTVGPFSAPIRPFTVNGRSTLCYVCVNDLLGFEVGDLISGKKLFRVEVGGFEKGATLRHGCPSHGVGLTPDEKEVWVVDAHNQRVHIFDNTVSPPKQVTSLSVREQPGWVTFGLDGHYAYPSTGDVIDTATRKIAFELTDEAQRPVHSEKLLEIDFDGRGPFRTGDQFGVGRVRALGASH